MRILDYIGWTNEESVRGGKTVIIGIGATDYNMIRGIL